MMTTTTPTPPPVTRPFRTPVRGHAFAARAPGAAEPTPGQFARLIREPGNPADRYAVSVWVAGATGKWRIGYLDRAVAARIAPRLDHGVRIAARIDGWTPEPEGRWRRPLVVLLPDRTRPIERPRAGTDAADEAVRAPAVEQGRGGLWGRPPGVSRRVRRTTQPGDGQPRSRRVAPR